MSEFKISRLSEGPIDFLDVEGYLDAHTFEELESTIQELFQNSRFRIVVNLAKVDYISSAGAGVFIGSIGQAQDNDGNIVLLNPSENVSEVFDLLGLTTIFKIVSSKEEALQAF